MTKPIRIAGIASVFFLMTAIPPSVSGEWPYHNLSGKNGEVIHCDKAWISSKAPASCMRGDRKLLHSSDGIDPDQTFGKLGAGSRKKEQKDRENDVSQPSEGMPKSGLEVSLGVGKLDGYTKYQIGGTVDTPSGSIQVHFPLSELEFPLSVSMVSLGLTTASTGRWKFGAVVKKNITRQAGEAKDSDWGVYYLEGYSWAEQNTLDIYSESNAALDALIIDIDFAYGLYRKSGWSVSARLGYRYENFDYELSDLDQWYPSSYYYFGGDFGHDYVSGKVATYNVIYHIPYLEIATGFTINNVFSIEGGLGYSPLTHVADEDNHLLRDLVFKGDFYGHAVMLSLDARYNLTGPWFVAIHYSKAAVDADGRSKAYYFGYIYDHTIDQTIESEQTYTSLSLGYIF
jgi:outer membrane protease